MSIPYKSQERLMNEWLVSNKITKCRTVHYVHTPILDQLDIYKHDQGETSGESIIERIYYNKLTGCKCECCGEVLSRNNILFRYPDSFSSITKTIYCVSCSFLDSSNKRLIKKIGYINYLNCENIKKDLTIIRDTLEMIGNYSSDICYSVNGVKARLNKLSTYGLKVIRRHTANLKFNIVDRQKYFFTLVKKILYTHGKELRQGVNTNKVNRIPIAIRRDLDETVKPFRSEEDFDF